MSKQLLILLLSFLIISKLSCEELEEVVINDAKTEGSETNDYLKSFGLSQQEIEERSDEITKKITAKNAATEPAPLLSERTDSNETIAADDENALEKTAITTASVTADAQTDAPETKTIETQTDDLQGQRAQPKKVSKFKKLIDKFLSFFKRKAKNLGATNAIPESTEEQEELSSAQDEAKKLPEEDKQAFGQDLNEAKNNDPEIQKMSPQAKAIIEEEVARVQEIVKPSAPVKNSEDDQKQKNTSAQNDTPAPEAQKRSFAQKYLGANTVKEALFGQKKESAEQESSPKKQDEATRAKPSLIDQVNTDAKTPEQQKKPTLKDKLKTFAQNKNLINTPEQNAKNKVETALRKEIKNIYEKQFYPSYVQDNPTEANNIKTSEKTYKEFNTDMNEAVDKIIKNLSAEDMKNIEVNTKINELSLTLQSRAEDFAQTKGIQPATLDAQRETVKKIDEQKKNKPGVAQKINDAVNKQTGKIDNYIQERGIKSAKKNVAKQEKKLQNQQQNLEKAKLKLETKAAKRNQVAK